MHLALSMLVEQFRDLDQRRRRGLSLGEAARYRALVDALSARLAIPALKSERRECLRIPRPVTVQLSLGDGAATGMAIDFGGGGLCLLGDFGLDVGQLVRVERLSIGRTSYDLDVEAHVVWCSPKAAEVGLAFRVASDDTRDRVDRAFYRILELYLRAHEDAFGEAAHAVVDPSR